jgi:hypothetical protein
LAGITAKQKSMKESLNKELVLLNIGCDNAITTCYAKEFECKIIDDQLNISLTLNVGGKGQDCDMKCILVEDIKEIEISDPANIEKYKLCISSFDFHKNRCVFDIRYNHILSRHFEVDRVEVGGNTVKFFMLPEE